LLNEDGTDISDSRDRQSKPCYDQQALMRRFDIIREICDGMLAWAGDRIKTTTKTPTVSLR